MDLIYNILSFFALISIVTAVHEFGHYLVARISGVRIITFSIGFGKKICGFKDKTGTLWQFALLPLGGYVKMFGDSDAASSADKSALDSMSPAEKRQSFHFQSLPKKMAIVLAGPVFNIILTIIIISSFIFLNGKYITPTKIAGFTEDSIAREVGLKIDDEIIKVNGSSVKDANDIYTIVSMSAGEILKFEILRDQQNLEFELKPKQIQEQDFLGNSVKIGRVGISFAHGAIVKYGLLGSFTSGVVDTYKLTGTMLEGIGQIIIGKRGQDELGGPIRIAKYTSQVREKGLSAFFWLVAVISLSLGVVNLFPIPVLDGGHLMYYTLEALRGKPLAESTQNALFKIGLALLVGLMIFASFNDLKFIGIFK